MILVVVVVVVVCFSSYLLWCRSSAHVGQNRQRWMEPRKGRNNLNFRKMPINFSLKIVLKVKEKKKKR